MDHPTVQIRQLEEVLGFTRQGYYQYWKRQAGQLTYDCDVILLVNEIRRDHPRIGGRKLYSMIKENLNERGIKMGRDAFFSLLAINRLLVRSRRCKVKTTFSRHKFRKYSNLIRDLVVERPNQLWVADITYWFTNYNCLYISLVTDAYSKRIMGYNVAQTLESIHSKIALQMALEKLSHQAGNFLIHHSDRGIQYCSNEYVSLLDSRQVKISMTENGDPLENAIAERVNGIIKNEYLAHQQVYSLAQAQSVLEQAIFLYNFKRPHLSCNMLVPEQAHQKEGKLKRRWKNTYYKKLLATHLDNQKQD